MVRWHAKLSQATRVRLRDGHVKLVTIVDRARFDLRQIDIVVVQVQMVEARNLDLLSFRLRRRRGVVIVRGSSRRCTFFLCRILLLRLLLIRRFTTIFVV